MDGKDSKGEVKRFELVEITSKAFKRALIPSNINARFRRTGLWPLNVDTLMHDIGCRQAFDLEIQEVECLQDHVDAQEDVDGQEYVTTLGGMISISEGNFYVDH